MEAGGPGNPGRDWRLGLERGIGGWESWEERMILGGQGGRLGVRDCREEGLSPGVPERGDWMLQVLGIRGGRIGG